MNETKEIQVMHRSEHPAESAGILLEEWLEHSGHTPILLLLSGGSAFELLEHVSPAVLGAHITIGMLDERFDTDSSINNFAQFKEFVFYKTAQEAGCSFLDSTAKADETLRTYAMRFENALREWRDQNQDGVVISTLGVGNDGHTAGIMPFPQEEEQVVFNGLFNQTDTWVVGYDAGDKNPYRMRTTVTNTFLKDEIDQTLLYVVGDAKREVVEKVLVPSEEYAEMPARIVHEMRNVTLVTDIVLE